MDSKQIIKEKLATLPENLQAFIKANNWESSVEKIGKQLNLKEDQLINLENEVFLTLICLEPPSDFIENIKTEVGIDESTARTISNYINGTVFGVVMKDIKEAWAPNSTKASLGKPVESNVPSNEEEWSKPNLENIAKAMHVDMPPSNLPTFDSPVGR